MKTPVLDISFDAHFSKITNTYHMAITFSKYGLALEKRNSYTIFLATQNAQVKVYLSLLELSREYTIIDHVKPVHHIDFGSTSDLRLYEHNKQMYLIAIHTNGLC